jgi:hypothetical protein
MPDAARTSPIAKYARALVAAGTDLELAITKVSAQAGGDRRVLDEAARAYVEELIEGTSTRDERLALFILRCAAYEMLVA